MEKYQSSILILLIALLSGCVVSENPISGKRRAYGYTWAQERQIGSESDPQIVAQYGLYEDEELAAYVERIGEQVLAESHLRRPGANPEYQETPFTFRVLDSPIVNAFALPGGYIYVTRGLLAHMNNEAQLAMVLGHEVGHVAARHASKRAATQQLGQLGLIGAAIGGQAVLGGNAGAGILELGSTATQLLFMSYGRDDERESDDLGVEYAGLSGYSPSESAAFFHSLKRISLQSESTIPSFLSTHPDPGEREQTILELAVPWEEDGATMVNETDLLDRVEGIVLGEDPRQGFVENNIFYHPGLKFRFPVPSGYQVINQPSQVAMVEADQKAIMLFALEQESSNASEAGRKLAASESLNIVEQGTTRVGGNPAYFVLADAQTDDGTLVRLLNYYIDYDGRVYTFLGYAARDGFATYENAFRRSMVGFERETDQRILNVQPDRLRIVRADRSGTFQSFLPSNLPRGVTAEDLAIINQVELGDRIERGQRLKLPR